MKILIKYIFILITVSFTTSCKKFLDVNTNPNSPTTAPINGLLARITQNAALNVFRVSNNITSNYVQYLASPNSEAASDIYEAIDASTTWTFLYDNMTDAFDMEKMAKERGATQYQGVAKIVMAMDLHLVHNVWGSAPFSSAFTGETVTVPYDDATAIFQKCIDLLDEGVTLLNQPNSSIELSSVNDLIHKGVTAAWIRTAHALKARLLNQLSKKAEYNPSAILDELAKAYTSTVDDAYITTFTNFNPWHQVAVNNEAQFLGGWLSDYYIKTMDGTIYTLKDPRLPFTASLTKFNDYRGTQNGKGRPNTWTIKEESYVSLTGYYSNANSPLYIITYDEMKFIEAEAAFRSGDKPTAYAAFLEGIKANMNKMGVLPADRDAYVNHASISVGAANLTLELIFREKYKAMFLMPVTWDDARRFNYQYQQFQLPLNVVTNTFIRRLVYPSIETSRNAANVPEVTDVTERLWWDD